MSRRRVVSVCMLCCWMALLASGCSSSQLAPTSGNVTLEGKPFVGGRIVFRPVAGGLTAIGTIQSDGTFVMRAANQDGAQIGVNHIVLADGLLEEGADDAVRYRSPESARVSVKANAQNEFLIDIRKADGWEEIVD